jgi:hypothetical protein
MRIAEIVDRFEVLRSEFQRGLDRVCASTKIKSFGSCRRPLAFAGVENLFLSIAQENFHWLKRKIKGRLGPLNVREFGRSTSNIQWSLPGHPLDVERSTIANNWRGEIPAPACPNSITPPRNAPLMAPLTRAGIEKAPAKPDRDEWVAERSGEMNARS